MRLQVVKPAYASWDCLCCDCRRIVTPTATQPVYADLDSQLPFKAYYCLPCTLKLEHFTTGDHHA